MTLARRLAEAYVELEAAAFRDKTEQEVKKNAAEAEKAARVLTAARAKAISYYAMIKDNFPSYPKLDEAIYYLAYEYEQAGDLANGLAGHEGFDFSAGSVEEFYTEGLGQAGTGIVGGGTAQADDEIAAALVEGGRN